jgi:hypothetical protein
MPTQTVSPSSRPRYPRSSSLVLPQGTRTPHACATRAHQADPAEDRQCLVRIARHLELVGCEVLWMWRTAAPRRPGVPLSSIPAGTVYIYICQYMFLYDVPNFPASCHRQPPPFSRHFRRMPFRFLMNRMKLGFRPAIHFHPAVLCGRGFFVSSELLYNSMK